MNHGARQSGDLLYTETLSSHKTEALFVALMLLFLSLMFWCVHNSGWGILAVVFALCFLLFLFYASNYRTLVVRLTTNSLQLKFGLFKWDLPLDNIAACRLDNLPLVMRFGGAGIHFMFVNARYRISLNFLEYPRLVISFKRKVGPFCELSFSTRHPDTLLGLIQYIGLNTGNGHRAEPRAIAQ